MPNIVEILIDGKDKFSDVSHDVRREVKGLEKDAESMGDKVRGALNIATTASLAAGVGIAAGILKASMAYAEYAERIRDVSIKTGESVEDASRLVNAADDVGVSYEDLSKSLGIFSKNMTQVQEQEAGFSTSLTNNQKVLESLGITVTDFNGQIRPTKDLLEDLSDVFSKMPDGPTKTGLAMQLFGRSGATMIEFLNQGREALRASYGEAEKWGQILSTKDVEAAHQFTLAQRDMGDALESMQIKIGQKALPVLTELSRAFTHGLESEQNFERFMKAGAFAIAALWTDAMVLVSNAIISGFEAAVNFVIRKVNDLSDKLRVPDFIPEFGGDRLFPKIEETSMKRADFVDPMEGFRNAFPDITKDVKEAGDEARKANPDMNAYAQRMKAQGEAAKTSKELLDALIKGETSLDLARRAGIATHAKPGQDSWEDAKRTGALEGFAKYIDTLKQVDEANFRQVATLSKIAELYEKNAQAGQLYVLSLEREAREKIDMAMADVFGKPTREQNSLTLQLDQLELQIERMRGAGVKDPVPGQPANWQQKQLETLEAQKKAIESQLRQSQLVTKIMEDTVKVNDRAALTQGEQIQKGKELAGAMATTSGAVRDLSRKTRSDVIPSMDEMRTSVRDAKDAYRVLTDDALRKNLIPRAYDVAGAFDAIKASAAALEAGAAHAATELNNVKAPAPAPAPNGGNHIKPPNVGDGGQLPQRNGFGGAFHGMGF